MFAVQARLTHALNLILDPRRHYLVRLVDLDDQQPAPEPAPCPTERMSEFSIGREEPLNRLLLESRS